MTAQRLLTTGLACWAFAACAPQMPHAIDKVRNYNATFLCDGTKIVKISFTPFAAVLETDDASFNLTQQPTAYGFLYIGDGQSLHALRDQASWSDKNGTTHQCRDRTAEGAKIDPASR